MKAFLLLLLTLLFPTVGCAQTAPAALVFTHVTVIDGTGARPKSDQTVVLTGGRIAAIGRTGAISVPDGAQVIEATGRFLIPGLWDMHVHWYDGSYLPLFLANGVTGVRIMFGDPMHLQWRRQIESGTLVGPRLVIASPIVDGPHPIWPGSIAVGTPEEGRKAVAQVKKDGYDFVKVYSLLPRDAYLAIADEAKKEGIVFAGHVPTSVTVSEASDAGQKSIEHLTGVLIACSRHEAELMRSQQEAMTGAKDLSAAQPALRTIQKAELESYDIGKARQLFARLRRNRTWQCPTLVVLRNMASLDDPSITDDSRLRYMPPYIKTIWENFRLKSHTPEDYALGKQVYARNREIVAAMRRAGVEFLAGTDTLNPYCFPGFSLHDELALLVQAGLTPMEALQAATRNPARFLGKENEIGTIERGKVADLVLLDADPLQDIHNTTRIRAVVRGGKLYDRAALDTMLSQAEAGGKKK